MGGVSSWVEDKVTQPVAGVWNKASGIVDPLDFTGTQARQQRDERERALAAEQARLDQLMSQRPEYKSTSGIKYSAPVLVNGKELDNRMSQAKNVGYTGDILAGRDFNLAQGDVDTLRQRAFGTETSPWAQKLYDQQDLRELMALEDFANSGNASRAALLNDLAASGGLEGGARERVSRSAARDLMLGRQDIKRQGMLDDLAIGIQDEAQRLELQTALPGMGLQLDSYQTGLADKNRDVKNDLSKFNAGLALEKAGLWSSNQNANADRQNQVNQLNTKTKLDDVKMGNLYDLEAWNQMMASQGASAAANAQARSGGKGGFFSSLGINI